MSRVLGKDSRNLALKEEMEFEVNNKDEAIGVFEKN